MHFIIICKDRPGALALRQATRDAHLAYVNGKIDFGGPFMDDADNMCGSVLLVDMPDRAAAEAFAAADPYAQAGLFESVEIHPFRKVFG